MRTFKRTISLLLSMCLVFSLFFGCADKTFKVTFDANGGVLNGETVITKEYGQTITEDELPIATREGYEFSGWFTNKDASGDAVEFPYTVTKSETLYAGWEALEDEDEDEDEDAEEFTVTFNANGGNLSGEATITKESGQTIAENELPTATRDGYTFTGWYLNAEATGESVTFPYTVTANVTLYAGWAQAAAKKMYLFEAEDAVVEGRPSMDGANYIENAQSASGGRSLGYLNVAGNKVIFTVEAKEAGSADLEFYFSSTNFDSSWIVLDQLIDPSKVKIELNGAELVYEETTIAGSNQVFGFNLVWTPVVITGVTLQKGQNTIVVTSVNGDFPNFDCLKVYSTVEIVNGASEDEEPQDGVYGGAVSYKLIVGAYPAGPAVEKTVIHFEDKVSSESLAANTFAVSLPGGWGGTRTMNGTRTYLSDAEGKEIQGSESNYVTVEYSTQFNAQTYSFASNNNAFVYVNMNQWLDPTTLKLTISAGKSVVIDGVSYSQLKEDKVTFDEIVVPALKDWKIDGQHTYQDSTYGSITLKYAAYEPDALKNGSEKNPLIIWLHGAGEGGNDPTIAVLGNEVTYLANEEIQSYFTSGSEVGAYILAVQSPTMWMDNGLGQYGDGSFSKYTNALWATIKAYVNGNSDIDTNRIYIGGCSNGGFMTINMLITDEDNYFAAAFPICQAYKIDAINEETLNKLAQKAIWFTHANSDRTVNPNNTNNLYIRLINAGAENVFYSYFATVTYDGVTYDGHWSWIYTLRNECKYIQPVEGSGGELTIDDLDPASTLTHDEYETLWAWIAAQHK